MTLEMLWLCTVLHGAEPFFLIPEPLPYSPMFDFGGA